MKKPKHHQTKPGTKRKFRENYKPDIDCVRICIQQIILFLNTLPTDDEGDPIRTTKDIKIIEFQLYLDNKLKRTDVL